MDIFFIVLISVLLIMNIVLFFILSKKKNVSSSGDLSYIKKDLFEKIELYNKTISTKIEDNNAFQRERYANLDNLFSKMNNEMVEKIRNLTENVDGNLRQLNEKNERKLEEMRMTVDEKLNKTLQERFNQSFTQVDAKLREVTLKLGEMKSLGDGVNDLKRVLSNIKTRGNFGEVQLANLLEQFLTIEQYEEQFTISPSNKVDFAIKMPGKDSKNIYLPIDAKFPLENYQRLLDAVDAADNKAIEIESKALTKFIKDQAKSISNKYISVPLTTDFAILYLPVEGLYTEVLRTPGLAENLQRDYRVMVCGPTTILAILNCLQMGFRTLNIEKKSSEIGQLLHIFKKEFDTFVGLLGKTKKKIDEASNNIDLMSTRTNIINKKLNSVSELDFSFSELNNEDILSLPTLQEDED